MMIYIISANDYPYAVLSPGTTEEQASAELDRLKDLELKRQAWLKQNNWKRFPQPMFYHMSCLEPQKPGEVRLWHENQGGWSQQMLKNLPLKEEEST